MKDFEKYLDSIILKSEDIVDEDLYGRKHYEQRYILNGHTEEDNEFAKNMNLYLGPRYKDLI